MLLLHGPIRAPDQIPHRFYWSMGQDPPNTFSVSNAIIHFWKLPFLQLYIMHDSSDELVAWQGLSRDKVTSLSSTESDLYVISLEFLFLRRRRPFWEMSLAAKSEERRLYPLGKKQTNTQTNKNWGGRKTKKKKKKKFRGKRLKKQFMQRITQRNKFMPQGPNLHNKTGLQFLNCIALCYRPEPMFWYISLGEN